ncbi:MAG: hypothetical protein LBT97_05670, partial [Planctomycetota bacterium]|nr:hypothetical protein [Planctomycetota bacterium]
VDAGNFRVIRGRDREEPDRARVDSIKRAIQAGREVVRVRIYQDKKTGEKFSPNGAHRQQAHDEFGLRVPAIIVTVADARERAERESCFANEDNGSSRSSADMRFQAEKAYAILEKKLNRPPKPKELAGFIHASDKFANSFLRAKFATAAGDNGDDYDEPESKIPASLRTILEGLRKIEPPSNWECGHISNPVLVGIKAEIRRIANHKRPRPGVGPEELETFMKERGLGPPAMAKLVEVACPTIRRWLAGTVKISESNARTLRRVMSYTPDQIDALLDDDSGDKAHYDE